MEYDFSGYVTKNNLKCTDGRTILKDAFKDDDGKRVPLVWMHLHNDPENVLGHAILENREDGVYGYCKFNDTNKGLTAKELVKHGDIESLSIYANQLVQQNSNVMHGVIREVSLVHAGANPGAWIDNVAIEHSDGFIDEHEDEAIIRFGESLVHADSSDSKGSSEKTIADVLETMNEEQLAATYALVAEALDASGEDEDLEQSGMEDEMKFNVFEGSATATDAPKLTHAQFSEIIADAEKNKSSFKQELLAHAANYGIQNIEILFPDARSVTPTPDMIDRDQEWVPGILNGTRHTPFSRIKSLTADITADEARAKGYVKGNFKKEEFFPVAKRVTTPWTIYKKQKLDRDDIIDITDFDVVSWLWQEMRGKLNEELARAILIGDGRDVDDDDKISEEHIRPIWTDNELYAPKIALDPESTTEDIMDEVLRAMNEYKGSGSPALYTTQKYVTDMLLTRDKLGHRIYRTEAEIASAMGVSRIVKVPVMEGATRTDEDDNEFELFGIIVNIKDYTVGTNKGGQIATFNDFDIDYNQYKYLIETRCSGCLTHPKSAVILEFETKATKPETPETPDTPPSGDGEVQSIRSKLSTSKL